MIVDESTASDLDKWFKDFMERQEKPTIVTDDIIIDLARSLCDDIPFGYEASHRLANLLFCYINRPKLSNDKLNRSKALLEKYNNKMLDTMHDMDDLRMAFIDLYLLFDGEID